jgi:CRP/FNR family transcriptional regulator
MNQFDSLLERREWKRPVEDDATRVLSAMPLFGTLSKRKIKQIARKSEFARFVPGDVVTTAGENVDFFQVVLDGEAEVRGRPRKIRKGDHFGGSALLEGKTSAATVVAADDLELMRLPRCAFLELVRENPRIALAVLKELALRETATVPNAA